MANSPPPAVRPPSAHGRLYLGTAGWALPRAVQPSFPAEGAHLVRYASVFDAVEINSTFRHTHRPATLARWAASVPGPFRFSVKMPQAITHVARLAGTERLQDEFLSAIAALGERVGCILVQLPPSLALDEPVACRFLQALRERHAGPVAIEPRHPDWFEPDADALLRTLGIARVAADPARVPQAGVTGGADDIAYHRLHGAPRVYYSAYDDVFLDALALRLRATLDRGIPTWCIFDNTTLGAATANALAMRARLAAAQAGAGARGPA
jgi:uncharacterized protein YecE (DUF72 family)